MQSQNAAQPRPCIACKSLHISITPCLCPECERDSAFYKAARKKGDPRQFLSYPELLEQWRRRRAECRDWKKVAEQAATDRAARERAELENRHLLAVMDALRVDLEPALALATELEATKIELRRLSTERGGIPAEQWRRLVQLAHPDKHSSSQAAVEATRWLLENRP